MPFSIKRPNFPDDAPVGLEPDKRQIKPKAPPRMPRNTPVDTVAISDVRVTCVDGRVYQITVETEGVLQVCMRDDDSKSTSLNYLIHVCHGDHVVFFTEEQS